jgi:hypothetical protein
MSDITSQVRHIVNTLENPEDNYCRDCECEQEATTEGECPDCGEELGTMSGFDYLTDALDIEYIVNGSRELLGARVLVCFGGPNVWVDTRRGVVDGQPDRGIIRVGPLHTMSAMSRNMQAIATTEGNFTPIRVGDDSRAL